MYRKGVSALIQNKNQEFLLVTLRSFEDRYFAVPGGGIEEGEALEDAVYREIQEELGISKGSLELVGKSNEPLKTIFKIPKITRDGKECFGSERYFFGFRFNGNDDEIALQEDEVKAYKWVPFSELKSHLLFDRQLEDTTQKILEIFPSLA